MTTTKSRTTYVARLCNYAGDDLDLFSADDTETLARHLGKRLISRDWLLSAGDTVKIETREFVD